MRARKSATGRGRLGVRPLLRQVNGKPHATVADHETEDARPSPKKKKSPAPVDASPKGSSDYDRDPDSSNDGDSDVPVSSADIKPSFDLSGKSLGSSSLKTQRSSPQRRPARKGSADGANDERPRKLLRTVSPFEDDEKGIFGEADWNGAKQRTKATFRPPPQHTYGKATTVNKALRTVRSNLDVSPKVLPSVFKNPHQLPTPKSSNNNDRSSQGEEGPYVGAEDYLDGVKLHGIDSGRQAKPGRGKKIKAIPSPEGNPCPQAPKFKVIDSLTQVINKFDPEELRREREEQEKLEKEQAARAAQLPNQGPCPMQCGKILPRSVLDTLSMTASVKEQQRFCKKHQVEDAERERKVRGYPSINWNQLIERLERHKKDILRMFDQPEKLHFRRGMAERIKTGKSRNLLQQWKNEGFEILDVGYYGQKGHHVMTNHISKNFATELTSRAASDTVMNAQGVMAYVQEVLVLELATVLIKEDMDVDEDGARRIMSESTSIGDLLHPSETSGSRKRRVRSS